VYCCGRIPIAPHVSIHIESSSGDVTWKCSEKTQWIMFPLIIS